jgi:hypothetical protein
MPQFFAAVFSLAILAGSLSSTGRGDELPRELPMDGAWVQYQWDWERLQSGQKISGTVTLSLVGRLVERAQPCRWVELRYVIPEGPEKGTLIEKMLIPENDLLENENPIACVLRTWIQFNDEPAHLKAAYNNNDSTIGPLLLWTPGALKSAANADTPKDIEYQNGRLKAAKAWAGKFVIGEQDRNGKVVLQRSRRFTSWQHADLTAGFAEAEIKDDVYNVDMTRIQSQEVSVYLLQDTGTGAKTALPDCN